MGLRAEAGMSRGGSSGRELTQSREREALGTGSSLRRGTSNASIKPSVAHAGVLGGKAGGTVSTNALQKMLLDLATNASTLASSVLNCPSCGSPNVALDGGVSAYSTLMLSTLVSSPFLLCSELSICSLTDATISARWLCYGP